MAIWVDADACPNVIKEILFRAAERTQTPLTLVANQPLRVPPSRFIRTLRVEQGFDVADNEIVRQCAAGDFSDHRRHPAGGGGAGEGRRGAESARGTLQRGDDPRAADNAGFYGDITGQRRSDRRPG